MVGPLISEARPRDLDYPMSVRDAAQYLGVSAQTVYLWVERKQIPHLRVMGRNIRFLKSDLEPFRASFRQEWVTQLLRQGDAKVFKKYSQMKLQMKREALQKLNRRANEAADLLQAE